MPDEEHGDIDIRDGHLLAEREGSLDMRVDEGERLAHAADRGAPQRIVTLRIVGKAKRIGPPHDRRVKG